ncbi:MAG TPA: hypothetical protein VKE40_16620, partial [Gemmataceae bacterium]|nr:hypothetical protein [Gemmataceae bacterium]
GERPTRPIAHTEPTGVPRHPDCVRIWKRLHKHCDELFTSLDDPAVPADNDGTERDNRFQIRTQSGCRDRVVSIRSSNRSISRR